MLDRIREPFDRLAVAAVQHRHHAEAEVGLGEVRRPADGLFELLDRAPRVARHHQHRPQPMPQRGVVRRHLKPPAEQVFRRRQLAALERPQPAGLVGDRALQHPRVDVHQRVPHRRHTAPPPAQMRRGLVEVAELPIGHRERIMQAGRALVGGQRAPQVLRRSRGIPSRERGASHARQGGGRAGIEGQSPHERLLGRLGPALVEESIAQPYQRGQVRRPQLVRAGVELGRRRAVSLHGVEMAEIVRPSHRVGREVHRALEAGCGHVVVLRRHEHQSQLAERVAELDRRGPRLGELRGQACVMLAHLTLNRQGHAGEIRQGDGLPRAARAHRPTGPPGQRRRRAVLRRGAADEDGRHAPQDPQTHSAPVSRHVQPPSPSRSVV